MYEIFERVISGALFDDACIVQAGKKKFSTQGHGHHHLVKF